MDFESYDIDRLFYDEMFHSNGDPRKHYQGLHKALIQTSLADLTGLQEQVTGSFSSEGISFKVYGDEEGDERIIPVDCLPRVLAGNEWRQLELGLTQRLKALNLFLADVYGPARIVEDRVIPVEVVRGCPQYRVEMRGFEAPHGVWVAICGTDLVRTNEGFKVLEDNLRVPSGVAYMLANRKAVKASFRGLYRSSRVRDIEHYGRSLLTTLKELAPNGQTDPTIALLTPGVYNSAFYEHMFLAREIGAELVEGRDLLVDDGVVYTRTTAGLRRVDVVYRRIDDDFLDPVVFREHSLLGVPGIMHAHKLGNVTLANAPGTGVADDKSVYAYVPEMIRYYLGEEPIISNVDTYLCRYSEGLEYTLDNLDSLVVKRVGESGGYGMLIGPHASPAERDAYAKQIRANPSDFISLPVLNLSRALCLIDGRIERRHVDLRPFVLHSRETRIVPDSLCRSLEMLSAELTATAPSPHEEANAAAHRLLGRMGAQVHGAWLDRDDHTRLLRQVSTHCRDLHDLVSETYFAYPIRDFPAR